MQPPVRMENTFQLQPGRRFPDGQVRNIIRDVLEGYLTEERYEPELCRQMTKTLSEVIQSHNRVCSLQQSFIPITIIMTPYFIIES